MGIALHLDLQPDVLANYESLAAAKGRSLEDELRDVLEKHAPHRRKSSEELLVLARELQAKTLKPGGDSTPYIRWCRDTNAGRLPGSMTFKDDNAGY